jgi:hypothetical protein
MLADVPLIRSGICKSLPMVSVTYSPNSAVHFIDPSFDHIMYIIGGSNKVEHRSKLKRIVEFEGLGKAHLQSLSEHGSYFGGHVLKHDQSFTSEPIQKLSVNLSLSRMRSSMYFHASVEAAGS